MDANHKPDKDNARDLHSSHVDADAALLASSSDRLNRSYAWQHDPTEDLDQLNRFTTTEEKGLSLGLRICYDIIKKHSGSIEAESQPGLEAGFTICLSVTPSVHLRAD